MYCIKCGAENPEESKFCINCGMALVKESDGQPLDPAKLHMPHTANNKDLSEIKVSDKIGIHCPKCKSEKILALSRTDVKGGYRAGRGCLGYLLFGPIGFLCGALGKKSKISTTNGKAFVCQECGFEFLSMEDAIAVTKKYMIGSLIWCILGGFGTILFLTDGQLMNSLVGLLVTAALFFVCKEQKELLDSLKEDGFDAVGYPEIKKDE